MEHIERVDLRGQVAVVTGGGRGLGRHLSLELARAGAAVAIVGRTRATLERTAAELRGLGARAELFLADVRDPDAAERVVPALVARIGEVDVLVNNAGILGGLGPVATVEPDTFWDAFTVNVRGPFLWSRAVLPSMLGRGRGRIINVSSGSARQAVANSGAYCASKAALSHLTAVLAAELTGSGVTTFAIAPMAATDMLHELVVSPRMPAPLRAVFAGIEQREPEILAASLGLFRTVLSGLLDEHSGAHLDSRFPLDEQLPA